MPPLRPAMHLSQRPPAAGGAARRRAARVADAVRKMMATSPQERYQTPGEAAAVLGSFLRRRGDQGGPKPRPTPAAAEKVPETVPPPPQSPETVAPPPRQGTTAGASRAGPAPSSPEPVFTQLTSAAADDFAKANEERGKGADGLAEAAGLNKSAVETCNAAVTSLGDPKADPQAFLKRVVPALGLLRDQVARLQAAEKTLLRAKGHLTQARSHAKLSVAALRRALDEAPNNTQIRDVLGTAERFLADVGEELKVSEQFSGTLRENLSGMQDTVKQLSEVERLGAPRRWWPFG